MDSDYSWVKFYPAAAKKLCSYQDKREELLAWLYSALPAETNYLHNPQGDHLSDIDPFSVFGIFNRHISQEKKSETAAALKKFLGVEEPVPQDFRGVSPLSNENSMFFSFKDKNVEKDIQNLWDLFTGICQNSPGIGPQFDAMTEHQYGIKFNLTMAMYWIAPTKYFPLDKPSRIYLNERGIKVSEKVPTYAEFQKISQEIREKLCDGSTAADAFAKITRDIYYSTHQADKAKI